MAAQQLNDVSDGHSGRSKANRREPKSCSGQVFNFKLVCFGVMCFERRKEGKKGKKERKKERKKKERKKERTKERMKERKKHTNRLK